MEKVKKEVKKALVDAKSFKARGVNVLVKVIEESKITFGSLVLDKKESTLPSEPYAEVVSFGDQVTDLKIGDLVYYNPNGHIGFELDGSKYCLIWESNLKAVISKEVAQEITTSNMSLGIKDKIVN